MPRGIPKAKAAAASDMGSPTILEIEKPKKSGTVTVACKIPQGLRLQLQHKMNRRIPTGRGSDNDYDITEVNVFGGPVYYVFGPSMPAMGGVPDGYLLPKALEGGYALTDGIPADFWATWLEQNELAEYVTNRMIFAYDGASAKSAAREFKDQKSGLEPLSRDLDAKGQLTDRRIPKPLTGSVARIGFDVDRATERGEKVASQ